MTDPTPFRPVHHYGPGVAGLAAEVASLASVVETVLSAFNGLHDDQLAILELLGGVDPGLMTQLAAAPVGTWSATVAAARAATGPVHPAGTPEHETRPRTVWTANNGNTTRPEDRFWTRDRRGVREMWPPMETPGAVGRRMQRIDWNVALDERGPLTEITQEEYELDANREAGDGRDND